MHSHLYLLWPQQNHPKACSLAHQDTQKLRGASSDCVGRNKLGIGLQALQPAQATFVTDPATFVTLVTDPATFATHSATFVADCNLGNRPRNLCKLGNRASNLCNRASKCLAGLPCEDHSLCNGRNKLCIARGPAWPDNFRSNEIIAQRQADKARELLTSATEEVSGDFRLCIQIQYL